jgi:TPR repeat protein
VPAAQPSATTLALLRRGEALMGIGDLSGARLFFARAAEGGSGRAALLLGATFDPRDLASLGARGITADPAAARRWYRRAAALGETDAEDRLRALDVPFTDPVPQDTPR